METRNHNALNAAVVKLLRPLVRIFIRNGFSCGAFTELARWVYVDVAREEFPLKGRKQTDSRVSVLTGLSRKEVRRLRDMQKPVDTISSSCFNRAARVISGWRRDPQFCDIEGRPNVLPLEGEAISFTSLVKLYSGDISARAILDELLANRSVVVSPDNMIRLTADVYLHKTDKSKMHEILGKDVGLLVNTIDHNIEDTKGKPWLQRKVSYDNIPAEAVEKIRRLSTKSGQTLLEHLDRLISQYDRDVNPKALGAGRKLVGVGVYYFEEDVKEGPFSPDDDGGES